MSQPIKILHLVSRLDGYGTTGQLRLLARQQLADGHSVSIAALATDRLTQVACQQEGVRLSVLDRRWRRDPFAALRLARELRGRSFDVAHIWDQEALEYFAVARGRSHQRPTLATLAELPRVIRRPDLVDRVVATSEAGRRQWERRGIASGRIAVIPPGVFPGDPEPTSREEFLRATALPQDSKTIAVSGQLVRANRVDDAIWFFELVRTLDERARLLVFGDGPDRHRLERFTRLTSEPAAVRFLGYRDDQMELLPHVDVFWSLGPGAGSLCPPTSVLEAMASRVPVVTVDEPACREFVADGCSGYLVAPTDRAGFARQTLRLLDNRDLADEMAGAAANQIATLFSSEAMTRAYTQLYRELLGGDAAVVLGREVQHR